MRPSSKAIIASLALFCSGSMGVTGAPPPPAGNGKPAVSHAGTGTYNVQQNGHTHHGQGHFNSQAMRAMQSINQWNQALKTAAQNPMDDWRREQLRGAYDKMNSNVKAVDQNFKSGGFDPSGQGLVHQDLAKSVDANATDANRAKLTAGDAIKPLISSVSGATEFRSSTNVEIRASKTEVVLHEDGSAADGGAKQLESGAAAPGASAPGRPIAGLKQQESAAFTGQSPAQSDRLAQVDLLLGAPRAAEASPLVLSKAKDGEELSAEEASARRRELAAVALTDDVVTDSGREGEAAPEAAPVNNPGELFGWRGGNGNQPQVASAGGGVIEPFVRYMRDSISGILGRPVFARSRAGRLSERPGSSLEADLLRWFIYPLLMAFFIWASMHFGDRWRAGARMHAAAAAGGGAPMPYDTLDSKMLALDPEDTTLERMARESGIIGMENGDGSKHFYVWFNRITAKWILVNADNEGKILETLGELIEGSVVRASVLQGQHAFRRYKLDARGEWIPTDEREHYLFWKNGASNVA